MTDLALVVLLVIIAIVVAVLAVYVQRLINPHRAPRKLHPNAQWRIDEHPRAVGEDGPSAYAVYCVHPDEESQLIDAVYWKDPDFDAKMEEARVEAMIRCDTLNRRLKP